VLLHPVLVILLGVVGLSALTGYLDCAAACAGDFHRLDHLRHPTKTPSRCLLHPEFNGVKK
jgi:hypothetical protein